MFIKGKGNSDLLFKNTAEMSMEYFYFCSFKKYFPCPTPQVVLWKTL